MFSRLKCSTDVVWDVSGVDVVGPAEFVSTVVVDC